MSVPPAIMAVLLSSAPKFDFFLYVQSTPAMRLWSGISPYELSADGVDRTGGQYVGLGRLEGIPQLNQLINGSAERVEFTLSGVDADAVALADESSAALRNAPVNLGIGFWSADDQLIAPVFWLWAGTSDAPRVSQTPGDDGVPVRQLTLSVGSLMTSRRRPRFGYWTDIEHQQDFPGDTFFSQVALYNASTTVRWPQ